MGNDPIDNLLWERFVNFMTLETITRKVIYQGKLIDATMPSFMTKGILKEHCSDHGIMVEETDGKPDYSTVRCAKCGFKLYNYFLDPEVLSKRKPWNRNLASKGPLEKTAA